MLPGSVHKISAVMLVPPAPGLSPILADDAGDMPIPTPKISSSDGSTSAATSPVRMAPRLTQLRKCVLLASDTAAMT